VRAVRKLIEQDKVQILLSPLSGDEGIAVKNFAKTHPELTFVNAASGAQETTYVDPAPNFFRYNMDGAQWQVGLANMLMTPRAIGRSRRSARTTPSFTRRCSGWCSNSAAAGGKITNRQWVPLGTKDFASVIAALPDDVDAIYLGLGRLRDAVNFLNQYQQAGARRICSARLDHGRPDHPFGQGQRQERADWHGRRQRPGRHLGRSGWQAFVKDLSGRFPPPEKRFPSPSLLATNYYNSTMALGSCAREE